MKNKTLYLSQGAIIAALYVVLTLISPNPVGLFQLRISEAMTVLPAFLPAAVPGLFVGCVLANVLSSALIWDVIIGSATTLLAAHLTYKLGKKNFFLAVSFPIILNTLTIPPVLVYVYNVEKAWWLVSLSVLAGETLSAGGLGYFLYKMKRR